jgi:hypothetical protein
MSSDRIAPMVHETASLPNGKAYHSIPRSVTVDWTTPGLYITRLRLLSDPGFPMWDVSYCHGQLPDGTEVRVQLPFSQVPRRGMKAFLYQEAKKTGVFIRGLFDNISTLS